MIVGTGDVARTLEDREDLLFFAAGVSNSGEVPYSEYQREVDLLLEQPRDAHIVYFSSLGVLNGMSRYMQHKREMEGLVKKEFEPFTIVRIGNLVPGKNPHTIINYLRDRIDSGEPFEIQDVYRYIVDEEEFRYWLSQIPPWSCEMNIPGRRMHVKDIVAEIIEGKL